MLCRKRKSTSAILGVSTKEVHETRLQQVWFCVSSSLKKLGDKTGMCVRVSTYRGVRRPMRWPFVSGRPGPGNRTITICRLQTKLCWPAMYLVLLLFVFSLLLLLFVFSFIVTHRTTCCGGCFVVIVAIRGGGRRGFIFTKTPFQYPENATVGSYYGDV